MKRGDELHAETLMCTYPKWERSYPESVHTRPLRDDTRRPMEMLSWLLVPAYLAVVGVVLWALHGIAGAL